MMLVVDQDQFVAGRRIREADAARVGAVGGASHRALRGKLGIGQREQMGEVFGRQAGDAEGHGTSPIWCH